MKNILKITLCLLLLGCSSSDNENNQPSINEYGQNTGRLKSIHNQSYTIEYYYQNNLLSSIVQIQNAVNTRKDFVYENGRPVSILYYRNNSLRDDLQTRFEYQGVNIIKSISLEDGIWFTHNYQYNINGQIVSESQFNNDNLASTLTYTYTDNGNINTYSSEYPGPPPFVSTSTFVYDSMQNPYYNVYPEPLRKIYLETPNNRLTPPGSSISYEYEYNSIGQPVKLIFHQTGQPDFVQTYEYY